jgi:hypothetical protein
LAVVWVVAAGATIALRRATSPSGRRALSRLVERAQRKLRFWSGWLACLADELRGRRPALEAVDEVQDEGIPSTAGPRRATA